METPTETKPIPIPKPITGKIIEGYRCRPSKRSQITKMMERQKPENKTNKWKEGKSHG